MRSTRLLNANTSLFAASRATGRAVARSGRLLPAQHFAAFPQAFAQLSAQADRLRRPLSSTLGGTANHRIPSAAASVARWLEQLNKIATWVYYQDLGAAWSRHDVIAELHAVGT